MYTKKYNNKIMIENSIDLISISVIIDELKQQYNGICFANGGMEIIM